MPDHVHVYARVPKLAGSWVACECGEPYRGKETYVDLLNERNALLAAVPTPGHGYTTNAPGPHEIILHFDTHEEMLEWVEALAAVTDGLK